jgi:thiamine pyrophosphate-dependent acetolactate synthase large subunit-like protein
MGVAQTMKVHAAIARALADNGVTTMFGIIGDANLYMADSFVREQGGAFVSASNEAGATVMALGYATVSGKVGVATVTHGPALTNTMTGLVEGVKGQLPLLLLCGDTSTEDRDGLQNVPQRELIVATGAGFEQLRSPATLCQDVATALRRAVLERRPIALNVPVNMQWLDAVYETVIARFPERRGFTPAGQDFDNAIGIIAAARRPIVVAGRGCTDPAAQAAVLRLARRIGAPVATTLKGKGMFAGEPGNLGVFGTLSTPVAVEAITEADTVLFFGASVNRFTTSAGTFLAGKRVVQCNADATDIGRFAQPDAALVGDPGLMADHIVDWLDRAEVAPSGFASHDLDARLQAYSPLDGLNDMSTADTIDLRKAIARLSELVPADRMLVTDGGRFLGVPWTFVDVSEPRAFVYTIHFGSIGLGMAYAIGAGVAAPSKPVFLVTGDGGFMLGGLAEFNTAVRHKVDLIVALCNDSSYGAEHIQFRNKDMDPSMSIFDWPEFGPLATALGGHGVTVRTEADLEATAQTIRDRDRPLLIDLKLDPDRVPAILR